jgi:hypothetical protein
MRRTKKSVHEIYANEQEQVPGVPQEWSSPLSLDVIPNYMGINVTSVDAMEWAMQDDGQLVELTIHFKPDPHADEEEGVGDEVQRLRAEAKLWRQRAERYAAHLDAINQRILGACLEDTTLYTFFDASARKAVGLDSTAQEGE